MQHRRHLLIIRPGDANTAQVACWGDDVTLQWTGMTPTDLRGPSAVHTQLTKVISDHDIVLFYGHASAFSLYGHGLHGVIGMTDAVTGQLRDKVVYTVACWSALILGRVAAVRGARAYFGYSNQYAAWITADDEPTFRQLANAALLRMMLRGETAHDALRFARQAYLDAINFYLSVDPDDHPDATVIAADLAKNHDRLSLWGDVNARI